ncbi:uncharacterized protein C14orf119 homolog [Grammomys surdaster]|uniref:uncharacterized protein C14orf119 homolog n=1 Tax=Grammomys surdaster TaxID=491861 RepID=UPI00109F1A23|nr:uncharacterized protein C14orf119 homolog [Grammomys surdaster]
MDVLLIALGQISSESEQEKRLGELEQELKDCCEFWVPSEEKREDVTATSVPLCFPSVLSSVPDDIASSSRPPTSYITSQEMKCILHWLASWSGPQWEHFLQDLVAKAVLGMLQPLLDGLEQLSVSAANRPPCIFEYLWDQWFRGWAEQECNEFVRQMEVSEPDFVLKFYQAVAATAGND